MATVSYGRPDGVLGILELVLDGWYHGIIITGVLKMGEGLVSRNVGEAVKEVPRTALQFAVGTLINEIITQKMIDFRGLDTPGNRVLSGVLSGIVTSIVDPHPLLSTEGPVARALIGGGAVAAAELHRHWYKDQLLSKQEFDQMNKRWVCGSVVTFATVSAVIVYFKVNPHQ